MSCNLAAAAALFCVLALDGRNVACIIQGHGGFGDFLLWKVGLRSFAGFDKDMDDRSGSVQPPFTSTFFDFTAFRRRHLNTWTLSRLYGVSKTGLDRIETWGRSISVLGARCMMARTVRLLRYFVSLFPGHVFYLLLSRFMLLSTWRGEGGGVYWNGWRTGSI